MRKATITRQTTETDITLTINLDGSAAGSIETPSGFFNHMLALLNKHSGFDLTIKATGDVQVDEHHLIEDIGIALGQALFEALGDKRGIFRYADILLPMDEALILAAVDISGRAYLALDIEIPTEKVGDFDTQLIEEFLRAFTVNAGITLHIRQLAGTNTHHIIEATFKALARVLKAAVAIDARNIDSIPSSKGTL